MAYIVLVVNVPSLSIADLNGRCEISDKVAESINGCSILLDAINAGNVAASVQVTTRSTDPSVGTVGSGSAQKTYSHL